jgi:hypothetical protein
MKTYVFFFGHLAHNWLNCCMSENRIKQKLKSEVRHFSAPEALPPEVLQFSGIHIEHKSANSSALLCCTYSS